MILYSNPNPGRPPLGGQWQYVSHGIYLSGETLAGVVELASALLSTKLYTKAEVEQLVLAQERERCPWLVREKPGEITMPKHQVSFREYAKALGTVEYLDADDAESRCGTCTSCPHNQPIELDEEAGRLLYLLSKGQSALGWCELHNHPNAIACQVNKRVCARPEQPTNCWAK